MNVLERILHNLKTIADISKGERISNAKEFIVKDEPSLLQGLWRRKAGDSRTKAVISICQEVRFAIAISEYISESYVLREVNEVSDDKNDKDNTTNTNLRNLRVDELKKICFGLYEAKR